MAEPTPPTAPDRAFEAARDSGLLHAGEPILILVSGGADSVCLLDVATRLGCRATALHVNYGLRPEATDDERLCRATCERLGVPLIVERVTLAAAAEPGNLQAEARERRYGLAERHAEADYAAAHTASDQAETVVYRLATSPGRRALLGMAPRRGRLVRPLLSVTAEETRTYCRAREIEWAEDTSNADPRFARSRLRHEVMPVMRALNPAADLGIAETARLLREEAEVLDGAVEEAIDRLGTAAIPLDELREQPAGLSRLVLRRLAEVASGGAGSISRGDTEAILGLARAGGSASLDLGGGLRAIVEYGVLRFASAPDAPPPEPATLSVPGTARFGAWEVEARLGDEGEAIVSATALGGRAIVRAWRSGDRMRPAGLGGTKSLQDIFTDRKVPRALRSTLPVVESGGEIVWVAGVAAAEDFQPRDGETVALSARRLA